MNRHSLWRSMKKKPLAGLIGGFAVAAVAIGIVVLVIWLFIEPMSAPEQTGTVQFHVAHFNLWYQKDAAGIADRIALAKQLQHDLGELVDLLQVDPDLIPDPIDVFVHDDLSSMQSSIAKRKNPESRGGYIAPFDLLASESPRRRLAELVLAFGWGQCGSRLLEHGVSLYASDPDRNFHAVIAALPRRLYHPLQELILMENRGGFPESIYERYDSPYSRVLIGLADYKKLLDLSASEADTLSDIGALEAASFVQYLIEHMGGMRELKRIWGKGSTERLLARVEGVSIADLGNAWYATGRDEGSTASDYEYLQVYYLLADGKSDVAWNLARELMANDSSQEALFLAGRCAVSVGEMDEAKEIVSRLEDQKQKRELQNYLDLYADWSVSNRNGLRFVISPHISAENSQKLISRAQRVYVRIIDQLALDGTDVPQPLVVFVYGDSESLQVGEGLVPLSSVQNGMLHIMAADDIAYDMARVLPAYAWGNDTYSRLLRSGLAVALSCSRDELVEQACALCSKGTWIPLTRVDFGVADEKTIKIEAGLMLRYLLDNSVQDVREVWIATSPLGLYLSVDAALKRVFGKTRKEIEETLVSSVLLCK